MQVESWSLALELPSLRGHGLMFRSAPFYVVSLQSRAEYAFSKCGIFGMWIILSWKHQDLKDSRKILLPLNCVKEFRWGPGPEKELLPEIIFIWKTHLHGRANICSSHPLVNYPPSLWCPRPLIPFLSSSWHVNLNCLTAFGSHIFIGFFTYKNTFVFLL